MLTTHRGGGERTPIQITEFVPARTLMEEIVFAVTGNIFPQFGKNDKKNIRLTVMHLSESFIGTCSSKASSSFGLRALIQ